jgi:hypothetical protein
VLTTRDGSEKKENHAMKTVADLIAELATLDPSASLIQSKDAEGNSFSPTYEVSIGFYRAENTYRGEFLTPLTDEDRASGRYTEEDEYEPQDGDVAAVCFWPTN